MALPLPAPPAMTDTLLPRQQPCRLEGVRALDDVDRLSPAVMTVQHGLLARDDLLSFCHHNQRGQPEEERRQASLSRFTSGDALGCHRRIPESALSEYNYYMDTSKLRITVSNMKNANSRAELERIKTTILENLSKLPAAPSVPFEHRPPPLATVRAASSPCQDAMIRRRAPSAIPQSPSQRSRHR